MSTLARQQTRKMQHLALLLGHAACSALSPQLAAAQCQASRKQNTAAPIVLHQHVPAQVQHSPFVVHSHFVDLGSWPRVQCHSNTWCSRLVAALIGHSVCCCWLALRLI